MARVRIADPINGEIVRSLVIEVVHIKNGLTVLPGFAGCVLGIEKTAANAFSVVNWQRWIPYSQCLAVHTQLQKLHLTDVTCQHFIY